MLSLSKDISLDGLKIRMDNPVLGYWNLKVQEEQEFVYQVPSKYLTDYSEIQLKQMKGSDKIDILSCEIKADGQIYKLNKVSGDNLNSNFDISTLEGIKANNECMLIVKIKSQKQASGIVMIKK